MTAKWLGRWVAASSWVDSSGEAAEVMRARLGGDRVVYLDATGSELE